MGPLLEAIRTNNREKANEWASSEHWATVEQLISATSSAGPSNRSTFSGAHSMGSIASGSGVGGGAGSSDNSSAEQISWTCSYCTFLNSPNKNTCDMCSLPR